MPQIPVQQILDNYLRKVIAELDNDNFRFRPIEVRSDSSWPQDGLVYRMTCSKCRHRQEQAVTDWSSLGGLDSLIESMVQFSKSHQHIESPPERVFRLD